MTRSPVARAGQIEGAELGFNCRINSGNMTSVNGQVKYEFIAPFDGYVTAFDVTIKTTFTNAAATAFLGTTADSNNDDLLNDFVIQNLTGYNNAIGSSLWVSKAVTKGSLYACGFTNADTTGVGCIGITLSPGPGPLV